jgi:hypothetical protein
MDNDVMAALRAAINGAVAGDKIIFKLCEHMVSRIVALSKEIETLTENQTIMARNQEEMVNLIDSLQRKLDALLDMYIGDHSRINGKDEIGT